MGVVDHRRIEKGDPIVETDLNTTLTSWNDESILINADNVRMEGIDRRSIAGGLVVPVITSTTKVYTAAGPTTLTYPGWHYPVSMGGNDVSIGAFSFSTNQAGTLLVSLSFDYSGEESTSATNSGIFEVAIYYRYTGVAWTQIPLTVRRFQLGNGTARMRGRCSIVHRFTLTSLVSVTDLWFAVGQREANGSPTQDFIIRDLHFFGKGYDF